ncbi:MAG: hypothetical protein C4617_04725 [Candidatus Liberibacter europaeus]|uniref:Uncharacterized protein n=1 Tax=Candidatus Liberibacter europaeus TaxID=744859 RepID=A0A2T4VWM5_9HYPH|nr:hypothetical protein [Candidatus Liberibacter europaeus]PTL86179.1 MAG: hypothetical protein C4617_04725 [Candidatus Liberibacter europaeus]
MTKATHFKNSFITGEVSPFVYQSGSNLKIYQGSLVQCHNYIPLRTGALTRRPGTRVYHVFDDVDKPQRLVSFVKDAYTAYIIVLGDLKLHIFERRMGDCSKVTTIEVPYKKEDIGEINVAQNLDTLWIVHPKHVPCQLILKGKAWEFKEVSFKQVPQLNKQFVDDTKVSITLKTPYENGERGKTGLVPVEADGGVFKETDVGRELTLGYRPPKWKPDTWYLENSYVVHNDRLLKCIGKGKSQSTDWTFADKEHQQKDGGCLWEKAESNKDYKDTTKNLHVVWVTGVIKTFKTAKYVLLELKGKFPLQDDQPTSDWAFGEWGKDEGYPPFVTFFDNRLVLGGNKNNTQTVHFSKLDDFTDFTQTSEQVGTTYLTDSFYVALGSNVRQGIQWLSHKDNGLLVGTESALWLISRTNQDESISNISVVVRSLGSFGSIAVSPILVGSHCVFVQDTGRALISIVDMKQHDYRFTDLNVWAEHILTKGVWETALQHSPYSIIWVVLRDGRLVGCTFDPENEVCAWHTHVLGGVSTQIHSLTSFASFSDGQDDLWLLVERQDNTGKKVKFLEKLGNFRRMNTYQPTDVIDGCSTEG